MKVRRRLRADPVECSSLLGPPEITSSDRHSTNRWIVELLRGPEQIVDRVRQDRRDLCCLGLERVAADDHNAQDGTKRARHAEPIALGDLGIGQDQAEASLEVWVPSTQLGR